MLCTCQPLKGRPNLITVFLVFIVSLFSPDLLSLNPHRSVLIYKPSPPLPIKISFVCVRSLCDFLWDTMGLSSTMTLSKHFYTEVVYNDQGEKPQLRWRKIHQDTFEYLLSSNDQVGEELAQSGVNVTCRMCFWGESQGSERARRMLSCKSCGKKYHKNCVKSWAQHRDSPMI
ncbi:LOW QUALITY PROTEIN: hypothetical protein HID58_021947 [Brassica napus]|uniref:Uncharacterized protein n=1 Tax=Brassica napus TaxID=3708 RepID=A0ABQ8CXW2_BRANA|nr:LOW QUALITY PROTEIN: hypothetical protein HID58_021947 [Brassica napus]